MEKFSNLYNSSYTCFFSGLATFKFSYTRVVTSMLMLLQDKVLVSELQKSRAASQRRTAGAGEVSEVQWLPAVPPLGRRRRRRSLPCRRPPSSHNRMICLSFGPVHSLATVPLRPHVRSDPVLAQTVWAKREPKFHSSPTNMGPHESCDPVLEPNLDGPHMSQASME